MKLFDINSSDVVRFTNTLEKMHRSALPVAVRGALNDAAFEAKTKFIPNEFSSKFEQRKKNFIKSHSAFNKSANTFDIDKMKSEAGIIEGKSIAGDELVYQEFGGTVPNRDFIPMKAARIGNSEGKLVSRKFYLKNIRPKKGKSRFTNQEFIRSAFKAGKGGFVLFDNYLFLIKSLKKSRGDKIMIKADPVYSYKSGRTTRLKKTPFIEPAGEKAANNIPANFIKQAERRINK